MSDDVVETLLYKYSCLNEMGRLCSVCLNKMTVGMDLE